MVTLESKLIASNRRPSGFDYLRPILALGVIADHTFGICLGPDYFPRERIILEPIAYLIVPAFFALSGFLIAGSLERCRSLISFISLRIFRIFPALVVEVLISAFLIGGLLTTLSVKEYFTDPLFFNYFWNILGEPQYYLPGVFTSHPSKIINGQIWTIPYELICYIIISFISVLGFYKYKYALIGVLLLSYVAQAANVSMRPDLVYNGPTGTIAVISFIAGVLLYRVRDEVPFNKALFMICLGLCLFLVYIPLGLRFIGLPIAYVIVYAGLRNPRKIKLLEKGDYSYGIYLYGTPLQQVVYAFGGIGATLVGNFAFASIFAICVAAMSWHFIELPIMSRKKLSYKIEGEILRRLPNSLKVALSIKLQDERPPELAPKRA